MLLRVLEWFGAIVLMVLIVVLLTGALLDAFRKSRHRPVRMVVNRIDINGERVMQATALVEPDDQLGSLHFRAEESGAYEVVAELPNG